MFSVCLVFLTFQRLYSRRDMRIVAHHWLSQVMMSLKRKQSFIVEFHLSFSVISYFLHFSLFSCFLSFVQFFMMIFRDFFFWGERLGSKGEARNI